MKRDVERIKAFCRKIDNAECDVIVKNKKAFNIDGNLLFEY